MKNLIIILTLSFIIVGCQRGKLNELSVDFNKTLIIPPVYDLPEPGQVDGIDENQVQDIIIGSNEKIFSDQTLVQDILDKTNSKDVNSDIRDQIDYETGYKNEDGFFEWLLKGKSKRENNKALGDTIDPFEENSKNISE